MKRNNIFMLAYIIFIFLCVEVKSFWDFPMWGKIIAAVTTASWLFAVSDCFSCAANVHQKTQMKVYRKLRLARFDVIE